MFRAELWKEQRLLEVVGRDGLRCLRKHFPDPVAVAAELRFLGVVAATGSEHTPLVLGHGDTYVDLEYIEGIRLYNLLDTLRTLEPENEYARAARGKLIDRCVAACARVQRALADAVPASAQTGRYPIKRKLISLLRLFDHCLALGLDLTRLELEAVRAEDFLRDLDCAVPFRDAAPKNLILAWPAVWRGRVSRHEQRRLVDEAVREWGKTDASPIDAAPIVHIDFSSSRESTVPEDDPISLLVHESSWLGALPAPERLLWLPIPPDPVRLAVGMAVRMYRLGGRRLGYRLLHANGYQARYADESPDFYFRCLLAAAGTYRALGTTFPALLAAAEAILDRLAEGLDVEFDWFEERYGPRPGHYYRDVFPY
jgi:hypothetical protein